MSTKKILIVGCGELGSRHLQAVSRMKEVGEVYVVDSQRVSLERAKQRLGEVSDHNPAITYHWKESLEGIPPGDCCIVATQAAGRERLIRLIAETVGYRRYLIEKIATQSIEEYESLMEFAQQSNLQIWVNCKTRAYGIHQLIKSKLKSNESIVFTRISGNFGLASNGIHSADLFQYYTQAPAILLTAARIDPILHTTKRGQCDLSGTLLGYTSGGSELVITAAAGHEQPDLISITAASGRYLVDQFQQYALECSEQTQGRWSPILFKENWMVSEMTKGFVTDILTKETCLLPTLQQCYPAHEFILNALLPHFNELQKIDSVLCPVT